MQRDVLKTPAEYTCSVYPPAVRFISTATRNTKDPKWVLIRCHLPCRMLGGMCFCSPFWSVPERTLYTNKSLRLYSWWYIITRPSPLVVGCRHKVNSMDHLLLRVLYLHVSFSIIAPVIAVLCVVLLQRTPS